MSPAEELIKGLTLGLTLDLSDATRFASNTRAPPQHGGRGLDAGEWTGRGFLVPGASRAVP